MSIIHNICRHKVVSTFASRGFSASGTFLLTFSLGHLLGTHGTGIFMIGLSIMMGLKVIGCLGMENAILKFGGKYWGDKNYLLSKKYVGISFTIAVAVSLFVGVIFYILVPYISLFFSSAVDISKILSLVSIAYPFFVLSSIICSWMRACDLPEISSFFEIGSISMFTAISMWGAYIFGVQLSPCLAMFILVVVVIFEVIFGYMVLFFLKVHPVFNFIEKDSFITSLPDYFIIDAVFYLTQWGGVVLLGLFVDSAAVGSFTLAHRLAFTVNFILTVFDSIVAPKFSYFYEKKNFDELKLLAIKTTKCMFFISLPIFMLMLLFPRFALNFLGKGAENGVIALIILAFAQFINVATGPVVFILSMTQHQKTLKKILIISSVLGTFCYLVMVPLWGINGAAFSILITMAVQNITALICVKKEFGFNTARWWL